MILRKIIPILIACSCLLRITAAQEVSPSPPTIPSSSSVEHTQDFSEIVVPITALKITPTLIVGRGARPVPTLNVDTNLGTGFCLDGACRFIVTNYHVAMTVRVHKIKRDKIIKRYFATGPQDKGATLNNTEDGNVLPYVMKRDLAILELRRSLPHHHGLAYSLDEPQAGQEVDIYGFPHGLQQKGTINHSRQLTRFPATFKAHTTSGLLAFDYELAHNSKLVKGASGGIVVDRKTEKIIGIMSGSNDKMAVAVPVQALVDFVSKVQPFLAQKIFPTSVLSVSADLYTKFMPSPDHAPKFLPLVANGLQHRPEEPPEVKVLRDKAQHLADSIRNFIAVQSFEWGKGDDESVAEAEFQVRVIDGVQRFRRHPDGKKEYEEMPEPRWNDWVLPADEWSKLPKMVGTEFRLKVHQAADVVVNKQRMKVFQYYASVEDNLCPFAPIDDYGLFTISETVAVACYGEVWTDEDTNIIRMSEHLDLSDKLKAYRGWEECQVVLTYGWLKRADEPPRLVPLTVFTEARYKKKDIY